MFLSAQALAIEYGIDDRIAKFYVDREPPTGNLYWKDKLLYLRPQPGYLFIPLIADLYFRSGISIDTVTGAEYVDTLETILHFAAEEEFGIIDTNQMKEKCKEFILPRSKNTENFDQLSTYFDGKNGIVQEIGIPFEALKRGDVFLYVLCILDIDQSKFLGLVKTWFALISVLLLMDDSEDYYNDLASGDPNVFIETGSNVEGFERIKKMLTDQLNHLEALNYSMAHALHKKVITIAEKPGIKEFLNS